MLRKPLTVALAVLGLAAGATSGSILPSLPYLSFKMPSTPSSVPSAQSFAPAAFQTQAVSSTCQSATDTLISGLKACQDVFGGVGELFTAAAGGLNKNTQQAALGQYCNTNCRQTAVANLNNMRKVCTAQEIYEIQQTWQQTWEQSHSGNSTSTPAPGPADNSTADPFADQPWTIRQIFYLVNLPCVQQSDVDIASDYCLPHAAAVASMSKSRKDVSDSDMNGVCTPCASKFFNAVSSWAPADIVAAWRPMATLCLRDVPNNQWCVPEFQAIVSMSDADTPAKVRRMCRTRCFQKLVATQFYGSQHETDPISNSTQNQNQSSTQVEEGRLATREQLAQIGDLCLQAASAGEYCSEKWSAFPAKVAGAISAGCKLPTNLNGDGAECGAQCAAYLRDNVVSDWGCCLKSWADRNTKYGDNSTEAMALMHFLNTTCALPIAPSCPTPQPAALKMNIVNINANWTQQTTSNAEQFWNAARADVAAWLGAAWQDVSGAWSEWQNRQDGAKAMRRPLLFRHAMSGARVSATLGTASLRPLSLLSNVTGLIEEVGTSLQMYINGDSEATIRNYLATAADGIRSGSWTLPNINQLPIPAFIDWARGASLAADDASTTATGANSDASATFIQSPIVTFATAVVAVAAYVL